MTVKQRQYLLVAMGYDCGTPDGEWGEKSKAACADFQRDVGGLTVDGLYGIKTDAAMIDAISRGWYKPTVASSTTASKTETVAIGIYGSKYFTRDEFRCTCGRCGGFPVEPTKALVAGCDKLRESAGVPLNIVAAGGSGVRCAVHNREVGGASNSNHLYGKAADLHPTGSVTPKQLYDLANKQLAGTGELGLYSWGIHFAPEGRYSRFNG